MHGVGHIVDITSKSVLNKRKKYYIVELIKQYVRYGPR